MTTTSPRPAIDESVEWCVAYAGQQQSGWMYAANCDDVATLGKALIAELKALSGDLYPDDRLWTTRIRG